MQVCKCRNNFETRKEKYYNIIKLENNFFQYILIRNKLIYQWYNSVNVRNYKQYFQLEFNILSNIYTKVDVIHWCYEEFSDDNFIQCINCKKYYCNRCDSDLVYNIHNYTVCDCTDSKEFYDCYPHYYCNVCALDCVDCDIEDQKKCPKCHKMYNDDGKTLCEFHYELRNELK